MKSHRLFVPQSMLPALLSGAKTQHRVLVKRELCTGYVKLGHRRWHIDDPNAVLGCPYQPGDEVWCPETWQAVHFTDDDWWHCKGPVPKPIIENPETPHPPFWAIVYQQDPEPDWPEHIDDRGFPWRSPATMPRWAARIFRTVKAVRVERVQDISEADAVAEGITNHAVTQYWNPSRGAEMQPHQHGFMLWWDATRGPGAWTRNDWVWVLDFEEAK